MSLTLDIADEIDEEKNEDTWSEIGAGLVCDHEDGEKYLDSSRGKVPTLEACQQSCEDAKLCKSVSYFKTKWCSHWSTPCAKTREHKKVAMSLSKHSIFQQVEVAQGGSGKIYSLDFSDNDDSEGSS